MNPNLPRSEYPRPDSIRSDTDWLCLNGEWDFSFDATHVGLKKKWFQQPHFDKKIIVPFVYQSQLSGINSQEFIDTIWYAKKFTIPEQYRASHVILNFGAVDFESQVFLNGIPVGTHIGGSTPFSFDISEYLTEDRSQEQLIVVRVFDPPFDPQLPKGKQATDRRFRGCDYQTLSGIWQPVWLEFLSNASYLERSSIYIRPNFTTGKINFGAAIGGKNTGSFALEVQIFDENQPISEIFSGISNVLQNITNADQVSTNFHFTYDFDLAKITRWSPQNPKLYRVRFRLIDADSDEDEPLDELTVTYGFRSIETKNGQILLNGAPIYLKFALYQGYFPESLWTGPSDVALKKDLELTLAMGFNGLRIHQIIEDPRFIYWADVLGVLLWGEMPNSRSDSERSHWIVLNEFEDSVRRDRCHPSIITWVPINESWGTRNTELIQNQEFQRAAYHRTKSLDPTRPVVDNDGWEHVLTDLCTVHHYVQPKDFGKTWPEKKPTDMAAFLDQNITHVRAYVNGVYYRGEPLLITEWGGWGMYFDNPTAKPDSYSCWGYQGILYPSMDDVLKLYEETIDLLVTRKDYIVGHVYTEFNDQYQEMNGFLTFDRRPKCPLEKLKAINDKL
jgi:beta-galactosidase/beta-glucuronidase